MQITEREIEIIKFINEFGFCHIGHIATEMNMGKPRCYQIMKRLLRQDLVDHKRIFYARPGVFNVSSAGAKLTGLPTYERISLATYHHQLTVIDIYQKLRNLHKDSVWISERRLIADRKPSENKYQHIPDGYLLDKGSRFAIEVELTPKSKTRLEKIIENYMSDFELSEVWYFCSRQVYELLKTTTSSYPMFKLSMIEEFLNG